MRHWSLKKKVTAMVAAVGTAFALFLGIVALSFLESAVDSQTAAARARLEAAMGAAQADLSRHAEHMARRAAVARIPQKIDATAKLALAATFTGAAGRPLDRADDLVLVTRDDASLALSVVRTRIDTASLPQVHEALSGRPAGGIAWVADGPVQLAAVPLYPPGAKRPVGALVVGKRVSPAQIDAWSKAAGGRLTLLQYTPRVQKTALLPWPRWHTTWGLSNKNPSGPGARLTLPVDGSQVMGGHQQALALAVVVALGLLWWATRLSRSVYGPIIGLERYITESCAGRAPENLAVEGDTEAGRMAANVNHLVGKLAHRDRQATASSKRLETLLQQTVDAVFLFDRAGRIREVNVKAQTLTGFSRDALLTRDIIACVPDDGPLQETIYQHFMACLAGEPQVFETRFRSAAGKDKAVEVSAGLIEGLDEPTVQAVVRDISRRKRMEAKLAEAEKMEGIGTLAGGIAHDFNNILGGILGYASLLKAMVSPGGEAENERMTRYTDIIERSATRASELTEQLLGYARGGKYQVKRVQSNAVIEEVASLMRAGMAQHGISIDTQLDGALPTIEADAGQLHQVLTNLCVNARDAMAGGGGGRLRLLSETVQIEGAGQEGVDGLTPGRYIRITVADTGEGMSPEVQKRIFEPFFTTKPPGSGSGLGLAMVYGIVHNHGGQVTVASRPGAGSAFRLYLPALERTVPTWEAPARVVSPTGETTLAEGPTRTRAVGPVSKADAPGETDGTETIMVVDDEEALRDLAREILTPMGYRVLTAADGEAALALFDQEPADLVILDIVMPRMGGKETFLHLRERDPNLRVVVSSGFSRHGQAHDLMELGADAFVQKPYRPKDMAKVVRETLDQSPRTQDITS